MFRLGLAMFAAALCFAAPVDAHWRNTRWGMTEAEVRQAYPGVVSVREGLLRLDGPTTYLGRTHQRVGFTFNREGRLESVVFSLAPELVAPVEGELRRQLGAPVSIETKPFNGGTVHVLTFNDAANADYVVLTWPAQGTASKPGLIISAGPTRSS